MAKTSKAPAKSDRFNHILIDAVNKIGDKISLCLTTKCMCLLVSCEMAHSTRIASRHKLIYLLSHNISFHLNPIRSF